MRFGRQLVLFLVVSVLAGCSSAQPMGPDAARALIEESAASIGGWDNINAIKTQEILTGGGDWEPMQSLEPDDGEPRQVNTFGQTILMDFETNRMRVTFDGERTYPGPGPVKFAEVIDGDAGMLETTSASGEVTQERLHASRFATRLREYNRLPVRLLTVAMNAPELTRVEDLLIDNKTYAVIRYKDAGLPVEVQFDSFNMLPVRVIYTEDDPIYGDTLNELVFSEWREYGDVRLPSSMSTFLNGNKIREEVVRTLINNGIIDEASFTIPEAVKAQPEVGERIVSQWTVRRAALGLGYQEYGREQLVEIVDIAPGVYHVKGGSHHSLAVEMSDHIVVVEMPLFEERSAAVIQALAEKVPGKPVKYGVMTHYHIDHSGGMREYAANGATLVVHESIVPFVQATLERPKTIRPDALQQAGTGATAPVEGVETSKTLTDGQRTIELHHIPNAHAAGMLVAYLPNEKLLFVSDLYTPGAPATPGEPNAYALYDAIRKANLSVDRIVGGHGSIGPIRDLARVDTPVRTGSE